MINQNEIIGKWDEVKAGIRNVWGKLTEEDVEKVKALMKSEYSKFWGSPMLRRQYPANRDLAGGFYLYMAEILKNEYPKYFR